MNYEKLINANLDQMWFNVQNMDKKERKKLITYVTGMTQYNCSFIHYAAKSFLAKIITDSECFYNGKGYVTQVKEFTKLGWYNKDTLNLNILSIYA